MGPNPPETEPGPDSQESQPERVCVGASPSPTTLAAKAPLAPRAGGVAIVPESP